MVVRGMEQTGRNVRFIPVPALTALYVPFLTCPLPHGTMMAARESPSGKASAFQADIRGFESRLPLLDGDWQLAVSKHYANC